jgi:hypothetical protein
VRRHDCGPRPRARLRDVGGWCERVIAEGRDAVISYLEGLGESDFAIDTYLNGPEDTEWEGGVVLEQNRAIPEHEIWTVTYRGGVYRVEAGPAALYFDDGEDEEEEEEEISAPGSHPQPVTAAAASGQRPARQGDRAAARRKAHRKAERQARRMNR